MKYGDYVPILVRGIFGIAAFFGLFSVELWGMSEKLFFGSAFLAIVFAADHRGLWSDDQYLQQLKIMMAGFSNTQEKATAQITSILNQSQFEHSTGIMAYGTFAVIGEYVVWLVFGWGLHAINP